MYKVKIFFGSFYGEWFENDFLEDMDCKIYQSQNV